MGGNFQAAREIAISADDLAQLGAAPLIDVFQSLDWKSLAPSGEGVDLKPLKTAQPRISSAAQAVSQSSDRLNKINADGLFPQIADPLLHAREQLESLRSSLNAANDVASVAPDMMGADGPRRYLLLIQNNAEARATGGIPGALAVLTVDKGKLSLSEQNTAGALGVMSPVVPVEDEQRQLYSTRIGKYMQDVNLTPDFPTSASTAVTMWEQKMGTHLDGVISVDPVSLGYILDATGPIKLDDPEIQRLMGVALPTELNGKNVVKTLLSDVYRAIPEPAMQDIFFASVAKKVFSAVSNDSSDRRRLIERLTQAASEGRILLWSKSGKEQTVIWKYPVSGSISGPSISPAQFGAYFNDGTGAKMDFYVKRTAQLFAGCTADGYAQVKVRITSTNTAPKDAATSLPSYVTGGGVFGVPEGSVQTNVVAYGPVQSNVETVSVAGKKTGFASNRHSGRPVGSVTIRLAPGQSSTVEFTFDKIVQHTQPKLSVTPSVQALKDVVLDTISTNCVPAP
ncbi:hypothetical protein SRABI83_03538 [Arthrobacter sp. Bi83]|nr:hypothetical protein SRABI83_03538 [Arthrobacter sp. Bi83]